MYPNFINSQTVIEIMVFYCIGYYNCRSHITEFQKLNTDNTTKDGINYKEQ